MIKDNLYLLLIIILIMSVVGGSVGIITLLIYFVSSLTLFMSLIVAAITHVILFRMVYNKIVSELKEMDVEGIEFDDLDELG